MRPSYYIGRGLYFLSLACLVLVALIVGSLAMAHPEGIGWAIIFGVFMGIPAMAFFVAMRGLGLHERADRPDPEHYLTLPDGTVVRRDGDAP
ncbi:hypothetical protein EU803_02265 [Loktanella sp. IMCC34160]|uniref:hypothetical protein n=1 Tax=Loktanella sp. IMCC34160 TaxID=2510646 RepID=UPI00101D230A|nr:hypothetical protein [Loktanella sp. IMCC34160]RYG92953.1 hypothetical protein EU803_02265 [Loktanella sp. IMCC34160]